MLPVELPALDRPLPAVKALTGTPLVASLGTTDGRDPDEALPTHSADRISSFLVTYRPAEVSFGSSPAAPQQRSFYREGKR